MNKGKVDILLGLQWGDEGRGKVVDVLTPKYDVVARFQGGPNAGHTSEFEGQKYVLRNIPSEIFQGGKTNIVGNGAVLAPNLFMDEAKELKKSGHELKSRIHISRKAHLIMPTYRVPDRAYEAARGKGKVGTTGKGIGPTCTDKTSRNGLRIGDILDNFQEKYEAHKTRHLDMLKALHFTDFDLEETEKHWMEGIEYLKQFKIVNSKHEINHLPREQKSILCEGVQGTMLDVDLDSYPSVTSPNTIYARVRIGLGSGPNKIGSVYGIMKACCTRAGSGPFPTELFDENGKKLRDIGHEYGAVTGRGRRRGWVDLVQLRYSIMVSGVTHLILMKSDVLDQFKMIKACVGYELKDGTQTKELPYDLERVKPIYQELQDWYTGLTKMTNEEESPQQFRDCIKFLKEFLETPIKIVSVGPDRNQTVVGN